MHGMLLRCLSNIDEEVLGDTSTLADPGVVTQLIDSYGQ